MWGVFAVNCWAVVETMEQESEDRDWLLDPEAFNTPASVQLIMVRGLLSARSAAFRVSLDRVGHIHFRLDRKSRLNYKT